jgi:hypothetical protein
MTEHETLMLWGAAAIALVCLLGPSAVWRIAKAAGEWLLVILVLIWSFQAQHSLNNSSRTPSGARRYPLG